MAYSLPDAAVTGEIITAAWGNDVRNSIAETAAAKAATSGRIFKATGSNALAEVQDQATGWLDASSAILPTGAADDPAERVLVDSAAVGRFWYELRFDAGADEYAIWHMPIPPNWDTGNITFNIHWKAAATSGNVVWRIHALGRSDDDIWDAALVQVATVTSTVKGTTEDLDISADLTGTPSTGAVNDVLRVQLHRDGNDGSDTMSGDAKVLGVRVKVNLAH